MLWHINYLERIFTKVKKMYNFKCVNAMAATRQSSEVEYSWFIQTATPDEDLHRIPPKIKSKQNLCSTPKNIM